MQSNKKLPVDFDENEGNIIRSVEAYTMTSPERIYALIQAVKYVVKNNIPGDIVECGVWRGGSMMAVAQTLNELNASDRDLYLFDTFEGATKPSDLDVHYSGVKASEIIEKRKIKDHGQNIYYAHLDDVKTAIYSTKYDKRKIHFLKGRVEDTIPDRAPVAISLLRLDTDWYESTRHELIHLFPRLSRGGVIIIDDYGCWQGAQKATDEYILQNKICLLLNRIDYTGRIAVKIES